MRTFTGEQWMMRIFIGENDHYGHRPLYEVLIELFRTEGCAGATVLRGIAGFGTHRAYHTDRLLELSHDLPLIIEVVDSHEKLTGLLTMLDGYMGGGTITMEQVTVHRYGSS
jgi:PII-like signaling protein